LFFLENLDAFSTLSVLVLFLFKRPKIKGVVLWLLLYVFSNFIFNIIELIIFVYPQLLGLKSTNNLLAYHLSCIVNVYILYNFFCLILHSRVTRFVDLFFVVPFIILSIFNFIYLKRTFTIYGLTSIWVVIKCLSYYAEKFKAPPKEDLLTSRVFWMVSGFFLYYAVAFFIFMAYDFITEGVLNGVITNILHIWLVHNVILAISCCFYSRSILCKE